MSTPLRDRFVTAESTSGLVVGNHGRPISRHTIRNHLRERGIRCRRPYHGPVLTRRHRQQCLILARNYRGQRWQKVVFSDESIFNLWDASMSTGDVMSAKLTITFCSITVMVVAK